MGSADWEMLCRSGSVECERRSWTVVGDLRSAMH
jgi:hypothetical protein